jgi:hypothetical protein
VDTATRAGGLQTEEQAQRRQAARGFLELCVLLEEMESLLCAWEHDAHLYFRRAKSCEQLLGDPAYQRELLARGIGL